MHAAAATTTAHHHELRSFANDQVRLLPGTRLHGMMQLNATYLLSLGDDRLLYCFRQVAGLPTPGTPLGGWEAETCGLRGHFVGHLLSACAKGATSGDARLRDKGARLVAELVRCQDAIGTGYVSAFPTTLLDQLERGERVWAPYYTLHKIMAGLLDQHLLCGNRQALPCLIKLAAYIAQRMAILTTPVIDDMLETRYVKASRLCYSREFGGMAEVLYELFRVTGDPAHRALAGIFDRPWFDAFLIANDDQLGSLELHSNTHLPMVTALGTRYETTGDRDARSALLNFCGMLRHHCFAHGGTQGVPPSHNRGNCGENWTYPDQYYDQLLAPDQGECCATHNTNEILRKAFTYHADAAWAEEHEKRFINYVMACQHPQTGMLLYHLRVRQGARKEFGEPDTTFWCCYGTGVEAFETLAEGTYFHDGADSLWVCQYLPSTLHWTDKGLTLVQRGAFPDAQATRLEFTLEQPRTLTVRIRIPSWAGPGMAMLINGEKVTAPLRPGSFAVIERTWRSSNVVELALPFTLRAERLPDRTDWMAITHGPHLLVAIAPADATFDGDAAQLIAALRPTGESNVFTATLSSGVVRFVPISSIVDETYNGYTRITQPVRPRIVDRLVLADANSERAHHLRADGASAGTQDGHPSLISDKPITCTLAVDPRQPMQLRCTYWGSDGAEVAFVKKPEAMDNEGATWFFDILIDDHLLTSHMQHAAFPGQCFDMDYPIPVAWTTGKTQVLVRFQARTGQQIGRLCDAVQMIGYSEK